MIKDLFQQGINQHIKEGNEQEAKKLGYLRGGSTGMMLEDGTIVGTCAAEAYLRMKGVSVKPVDSNKELMFAGGRLNEDHWMSVLQTSWQGKGKTILAEDAVGS